MFLHRTPIGYWRCYGLGQGKYTVARSSDGQIRIRTNVQGLEFAGRGASGRRASRPPLSRLNGITLQEFKRLITAELSC